MKTRFFVLFLACPISVLPAPSVASDDSMVGTITKWWPNPLIPEPPKEEVTPKSYWTLSNFGGTAEESKPNVPDDGTVWTSLKDKLGKWPLYTWNDMPESKTLNYLKDTAAMAKEEAKEKARREICELIKTCVKSMMWSPSQLFG